MKINQLKGGAALSYVIIFLTNAVGLVLTPFIIRSLGSAEYGLYTMIGALVGYMSVLDFGLNNTIVRFVAKYKAEGDKEGEENFLAHSFIMYFCISLLVTILGCILYFNLESLYSETLTPDQIDKAKIMMLLLIFNLAISLPGGAFGGICYGYEEFILPKITNIIRYVVRSILVVVILLYGADSVGLIVLDTIMNLLVIAIDIYIVFKILKVRIKIHNFDKTLFSSILGFSLWLFVFALVHQLRWQFGQMIIGLYYSTSIVAIYAVGITLGSYYSSFSGAIASVFLPRAMKMIVNKNNSKELTEMFIKISRIILIILFYILGGFVSIGKEFIYYWVGLEYQDAYYYAIIIMIGLTPVLSQGFANNLLEAKKLLSYRGKLLLILTFVGSLLSIYAAKHYGVIYMILITVVFMLLERILIIPYYQKKLKLNMKNYYYKVAQLYLCILLVISLSLFINLQFISKSITTIIIKGFIYTSIYIGLFFFIMTKYEKSLVKSLKTIFYKVKK